jgi:peptide/nickel transport system substrate-binding protein
MKRRLFRLRLRRGLKDGRRRVEHLGVGVEQNIEEHLFGRFGHLKAVRRFVIGWVGLMLLLLGGLVWQNLALSTYYQTLKTVPGGIYTEGVQGRFTNANPLFAVNEADNTVSRLIFSGLFNYDQRGQLVGDLARDYSVDSHGSTYTVRLKPNLTWQDGQPLTSADVVFTYQLIQNPDVQSPLAGGWQGIKITAPDKHTVAFKLPGGLAAFPYNLTNGIVPEHLLAKIPPADLRSADFNTVHPVGAGPFAWQAVQVSGTDPQTAQEQIGLKAFDGYNGGRPKLQEFVVKVFAAPDQLVQAFKNNQLTAVAGLPEHPAELRHVAGVLDHNLPLRAATMVFFKTSGGVLADQPVRRALVQATDQTAIIKRLGYPVSPLSEPILPGQVAYDSKLAQPKFDLKAAKAMLAGDGWQAGQNGTLTKGGKPLTFTLTAADTPDYHQVAAELQQEWRRLWRCTSRVCST